MTKYHYTERLMVTVKELKLGDVVEAYADGSHSTATVIYADEEKVRFCRPYLHTSDVETTAGIIPYVGMETWEVFKRDSHKYRLLESEKAIK